MIIGNQRERNRFLRFAVVGCIGAVVDFGTLNLLVILFRVPTVPASVVSFICAVLSNFLWNRYWTYPDSRSKPVLRQGVQFFIVSVIGLSIRTPLFAVLERALARFFASALPTFPIPTSFVAHNAALAMVILVVMFWNFLANRYWTYSDVE